MAYITNYTLHKLTKGLSNSKDNISKEDFIRHVYNDPRIYEYLNKIEISYLFNFSQILKEPIRYLQQVPIRKDTGTYVREYEGKLIYHLYPECELLNKDFIGFRVPPEVKKLSLIQEFRDWFESNKFIEKYLDKRIDKSAIIYRYNTSFARKNQLAHLNENYDLIVERSNTGHEHIDENFSKQKFYKDISNWIYKADNRLPIRTWKVLGKWHSYGNKSISEMEKLLDRLEINHNFRSYNSVTTIKEVLIEHNKAVSELMKLLREYFCWTYKLTDATFDVVTLENFNMKCCKECQDTRKGSLSGVTRKDHNQDDELPL